MLATQSRGSKFVACSLLLRRHHPPQRLVNLPLVSSPHLPEPGQHIGVQIQRDPLLGQPEPALKLQLPLPPLPPSVPVACGTPLFHTSRSPKARDPPAPPNSFLPFHLSSIIIHIYTYKINCKAFHVKHSAPKKKAPLLRARLLVCVPNMFDS